MLAAAALPAPVMHVLHVLPPSPPWPGRCWPASRGLAIFSRLCVQNFVLDCEYIYMRLGSSLLSLAETGPAAVLRLLELVGEEKMGPVLAHVLPHLRVFLATDYKAPAPEIGCDDTRQARLARDPARLSTGRLRRLKACERGGKDGHAAAG